MIERAITLKDKESRFYHHNEKLAQSWENFALNHNAKISGIVNSYILEVYIEYNSDEYGINIKLLRQLSDQASKGPTYNLLTKNTIIEILPFNQFNDIDFRIVRQNKILRFYNAIFNRYSPFPYDDTYMIISNHPIIIDKIINRKMWKSLLKIAELRSIAFSNDSIKIEYFNFLGTDSIHTISSLILRNYNKIN